MSIIREHRNQCPSFNAQHLSFRLLSAAAVALREKSGEESSKP